LLQGRGRGADRMCQAPGDQCCKLPRQC
jgi:hypothetical protein